MMDRKFAHDKSARAFTLLGVIYLTGYGWLLAHSDLLPYVTDNNETFSSIVHAANIYHFGIGKTFGLTDEAYGFSAAAHPYVYTHQGNFPRLFALLLYSLGARSAESQIILTTFTIGFLGVCFAFSYFSRITNNTFAIIFCLLLMSDYVMFAQWQVNTWQVWHVFFFFSSLLWIDRLGMTRSPRWMVLGVINFACLSYYEILFSVFVITFCGLYATYRYQKKIGALARASAILVGGPAIGAAILVAQNVAYLGWGNFLLDLELTYTGRNRASDGANFLQRLEAFYDQNHIVFWHNIVDASYLRSLPEMARHFFDFSLIVYTPLLVLAAIVVSLAYLIGSARLAHKPVTSATSTNELCPNAKVERPFDLSNNSLYLAAAFTTFAAAVLIDSAVIGIVGIDMSINLVALKVAALLPLFFVTRKAFDWLLRSDPTITFQHIMRAVLFLLLAAAFIRAQQRFYDPSYIPLWEYLAEEFGSIHLLQLSIITTVWVVTRMMLARPAPASGAPVWLGGQLGILGPYLLCGVVAYIVTAFLLPGYLKTVYLERFAPLTIFFHLVPFALLIYVLAGYASNEVRHNFQHWRSRHREHHLAATWRAWRVGKHFFTTAAETLMAVAVFGVTVAYWVALQSVYFKLLPPDYFSFLRILKEAPFKGASFAVNTYAAPIAVATGTWAYFDPLIGEDLMESTENGFEIRRDLRLLWLADKDINRDYLEPEYFLCIKSQYLKTEINSLYLRIPPFGCSTLPLTKDSTSGMHSPPTALSHKLVAADQSGRDSWAIVKMDWDYAPYLEGLDAVGHKIAVKAFTRFESQPEQEPQIAFDFQYRFTQQQGKTEYRSLFSLYAARDGIVECARAQDVRLSVTSYRAEDLILPIDFRGIASIGVTPRTETKSGKEYRSEPISIGKRRGSCTSEGA